MRRQFSLPSNDRLYLDTTGNQWETLKEEGMQWLLLHGWKVPEGYTVDQTTVALQIQPGYPDSQIDMAYFNPPLVRRDGGTIGAADVLQPIDGVQYQRWSRHRTAAGPWRPGEDAVSSHMVLVDDWLEREFRKP